MGAEGGGTTANHSSFMSTISAWCRRAQIPHRGGTSGTRLLLNHARDLIIHGPAHLGANGAAMPTDEGDQDGHFCFNHPERGGYSFT